MFVLRILSCKISFNSCRAKTAEILKIVYKIFKYHSLYHYLIDFNMFTRNLKNKYFQFFIYGLTRFVSN